MLSQPKNAGSTVVLTALSLTIGVFFMLMGSLKLTPAINQEIYTEMRRSYIKMHKLFAPTLALLGANVGAHALRKAAGTIEVMCGLTMFAIPGPAKNVANGVLLVVMLLTSVCHYAVEDPLDRITPHVVFSLLLACRLVVALQMVSRDAEQQRRRQQRLNAAQTHRFDRLDNPQPPPSPPAHLRPPCHCAHDTPSSLNPNAQ